MTARCVSSALRSLNQAPAVIKNIHLTDEEDEIEGRTDKVKGLVLRAEFLKKACGRRILARTISECQKFRLTAG